MTKIMAAILFATIIMPLTGHAQNPVMQTIFTADPAPMACNDTVYLYTGRDEDGSTWFTRKEWLVYSSADMVNWTDRLCWSGLIAEKVWPGGCSV